MIRCNNIIETHSGRCTTKVGRCNEQALYNVKIFDFQNKRLCKECLNEYLEGIIKSDIIFRGITITGI